MGDAGRPYSGSQWLGRHFGGGARGGGLELEFQLEFDSVEVFEFGVEGLRACLLCCLYGQVAAVSWGLGDVTVKRVSGRRDRFQGAGCALERVLMEAVAL